MQDSERDETIRKARRNLYGYAFALTRDSDQAADLLQECMLRTMATRRLPNDERALRAWLFSVLRNLWIDRLRAQRRRSAAHDDLCAAQDTIPAVPPEDAVVNRIAVRQAFLRLSRDHRDVLALVDIGGFSYEETASLLDVPRGTIMSRVSRARLALAQMLSETQVLPFSRTSKGAGND